MPHARDIRMHSSNIKALVVLGLIVGLQTGCGPAGDKSQQQVIQDIANSHIQANVPDANDFDSFLERDLRKYFSQLYSKPVRVKWEFLRNGPTQTGIAYPKYYLWVTVFEGNVRLSEGAVRLATIDKKKFDVTHFVDLADIRAHRQDIDSIFPQPVCEKIRSKL